MATNQESGTASEDTPQKEKPRQSSQAEALHKMDGLQWLREGMAASISMVILALMTFTLIYTFKAAGSTPSFATGMKDEDVSRIKQVQFDAYTRQKDIMMYALTLFGTVTGYYLGRVPAEQNAKRAQNAADSA